MCKEAFTLGQRSCQNIGRKPTGRHTKSLYIDESTDPEWNRIFKTGCGSLPVSIWNRVAT